MIWRIDSATRAEPKKPSVLAWSVTSDRLRLVLAPARGCRTCHPQPQPHKPIKEGPYSGSDAPPQFRVRPWVTHVLRKHSHWLRGCKPPTHPLPGYGAARHERLHTLRPTPECRSFDGKTSSRALPSDMASHQCCMPGAMRSQTFPYLTVESRGGWLHLSDPGERAGGRKSLRPDSKAEAQR